MINDMRSEQLKEFEDVNKKLLKYGWMLGPLVTEHDIFRIKNLLDLENEDRLCDDDIKKNKILRV